MKLEKEFNSLEEMAQFLRENGYYVSKGKSVEYVPIQPYYPVIVPSYPYPPITTTYGDTAPINTTPKISC